MTIFWIIIAVVNTLAFMTIASALSDVSKAWKYWIGSLLYEQEVNREGGSASDQARATESAGASEDRAR